MKKICQSCSMPMEKDSKGGGTNADGSKSEKYCSHCFENGVFINPEIDTPQKMQKYCIKLMTEEVKMPKWLAWLATRGIPKLERWKKN